MMQLSMSYSMNYRHFNMVYFLSILGSVKRTDVSDAYAESDVRNKK